VTEVRFALVGCGRVSARHIDALTNKVAGARIVAVCDVLSKRAERHGRVLGVPAFTSTLEMYGAVEIDVVDVATPSGDHFERVMEALAFNKPVVVEKPVALRLEHADEMVREAHQRNLKLWVAFQNRYNPAIVKAKETLDSGRLGKLVIGTVRVRWSRDQAYYDQDDWHGTWAMDGGVTSQQAIHHIDALRWVMGKVESVEATCSTQLADIDCEDMCVATLRFMSGALGVIEVMTTARPRDLEASLSIMGEKGTIVLGGLAMNIVDFWEFVEPNDEDRDVPKLFSQDVPDAYGFGHDILFQRVVDGFQEDRVQVEISGDEALKSLEILHAIYASHESGHRVRMVDKPSSSRLGLQKTERMPL